MTTEGPEPAAPACALIQQPEPRAESPTAFQVAAQTHALEALASLAGLAKTAASEAVRVSAANAVLDRAYGRPLSGAKGGPDDDAGFVARLDVQWLDPAKS